LILKLILIWLIPVVFGIISSESQAVKCTLRNQVGAFNLPAINVPADAKKGTFLSNWIESSLRESHTQCVAENPNSKTFRDVTHNLNASSSFSLTEEGHSYQVFDSPVAGIGYIVKAREPNGPYYPVTRNFTLHTNVWPTLNPSYKYQFAIRLVATGSLVGNPRVIPSFIAAYSGIMECDTPSSCNIGFSNFASWSTTSGSVTTRTCSIVNKDLTFPLPSIQERDLPNVGSTGGGVSQNLQLNCPAGTNLRMVITDKTVLANRSSTLTLAADSGASGFGIQILYNGVLIFFGPDSASVAAENQFSLGNNLNGTVSIPLTARYLRTAVQIKPGSVRALATYTMSYQ
jgi:type 1 fimbria pilin